MTIREAWRVAGPLLWEGVKMWAPQVRIPENLIKTATKYFGRTKKGVKKVRTRIHQIDKMIEEMEEQIKNLRAEREEWVLQWADLTELLDAINEYRRGGKRRV